MASPSPSPLIFFPFSFLGLQSSTFLCGTFMPPLFCLALPIQSSSALYLSCLDPSSPWTTFIQISGVLSLPSPFLLGHFISSFISPRKYYVKSINLGSERHTLHVLTQLWSLASHFPMCPCVGASV